MTDKTPQSGVDFVYDNGRAAGFHTIVELPGGGVGLFDYDNDGRHDLFFPGGGEFDREKRPSGLPSALFRNLGQWRFIDVTEASAAGPVSHFTHGCAAADYDRDGFTDVLVTGYGGVQLFHNQGDGTFLEVSQPAGMAGDTLWSTGAAWADFNGDQYLDAYVVHYVNWSPENDLPCWSAVPKQRDLCSPRKYNPLPDTLYYSNSDGTFRNASADAHLILEEGICGKGLGVVAGDLDLDGDVDIYVANDTDYNFLYVNGGDGIFNEVGVLHGVAGSAEGRAEGSMGTDLGDYDGDGLPDIWVANFERESFALYHNAGRAQFVHVSKGAGITALGQLYVGFGTLFADVDRDGDEDLVVSNGHIIDFNHPKAPPVRQLPLMLINEHGRFGKAVFSPKEYFSLPHRGRGLASSDLDDDGDLDFVFSHNDGDPNVLLANDTPPAGKWLRVKLIGVVSNRDAIGARLVLHTTAGDQLRLVKGGGSYLSQSDLRPFWGIPTGAKVQRLSIHWPTGTDQEYSLESANQSLTIVEPATAN